MVALAYIITKRKKRFHKYVAVVNKKQGGVYKGDVYMTHRK